jgi:hypothetical protein
MSSRTSRLALSILLTLGLLTAAGCGPKPIDFGGSARTAGVDGRIEWKKLSADTRLVKTTFKFLPPPSRIHEGATIYVLWFIPENAPAIKAGTLVYDEGSRKGHLEATTAVSRLEVMLTAERTSAVGSPSENVIARKKVKLE